MVGEVVMRGVTAMLVLPMMFVLLHKPLFNIHVTSIGRVSQWLLKSDCPVCRITSDRKITATSMVTQVSLVGRQRG